MPVSEEGVWTGPLPDNITVKEAAHVNRPWYGKGLAPFLLTIMSGSRVGVEWNEGRGVRLSELFRGIPIAGYLVIPYFCFEAFSEKTMQNVANKNGIDKHRQQKYEAIIARLDRDGRIKEAESLRSHNPFDPANHPRNPLAKMPKENLDGFGNNMKIAFIDLFVGHRNALERNESRGLRKLEIGHPIFITRIWESFEAAFGRRMEDIADKENLDTEWLPGEIEAD